MHLLGFTQFVCFSFDGQFTRKKYINFGIRYAFRSHDLFKLKLILKIKSYLYTQCAVCASVSLIRRRFSLMPKYSFVARSRCAVYAVRLLVALSRCVVYAVCRARRSFMLGYLRVLPTTPENYSIVDANLGMLFNCHSDLSFIKFPIPFSLICTASEICRIIVSRR